VELAERGERRCVLAPPPSAPEATRAGFLRAVGVGNGSETLMLVLPPL